MSLPIIILTMLVMFCLYLIVMFSWSKGYAKGVEEGRRQILEENIIRETMKIKNTGENLLIMSLYENSGQARVFDDQNLNLLTP